MHQIEALFPIIFVFMFLFYVGLCLLRFFREAEKCEFNVTSSDSYLRLLRQYLPGNVNFLFMYGL